MSGGYTPWVLRRVLLWLWSVLPLTSGMQWPLLWVINRKFLVGVMVIAFDDGGRVLVLHHTYRRTYPWGVPGGWLGAGETPAQGALRELREETGFEGEVEALVSVGGGLPRSEIGIAYLVRITGGHFRPNAEVDAYAFAELDALPPDLIPLQRGVIALAVALRRERQSSLAR
jgi:ADP-ribose pyrophosphatase YjhB (NUDIX family)